MALILKRSILNKCIFLYLPYLAIYTRYMLLSKILHSLNATCCRSAILIWLAVCCLVFGQLACAAAPTNVKFYTRSNTIGFQPYQSDLLSLALEKSRPKYGDYRLNYYTEPLSPARAKLETQKGQLINVIFATEWQGAYADKDKIIAIEFPVLKGLLGMRSFVVQQHTLDKLHNVDTFAKLQALKAGQVSTWPDTKILSYNKLPVITADTYGNLFEMLGHKRFDYLPLSILESYTVTEEFQEGGIDLQVAPNVAIFYPLPMFIAVSATEPEIAQRLEYGLKLAQQDGSFDALFSVHFEKIEKIIQSNKPHTFILYNPHFSKTENDTLTEGYIHSHGSMLKPHLVP